jgi:hypothetical protein
MKDGIYIGKVHGHTYIVKYIDGVYNIPEKNKKGFVWTPTILVKSRIKQLRAIGEIELCLRIN